jgi:hypothetical protein
LENGLNVLPRGLHRTFKCPSKRPKPRPAIGVHLTLSPLSPRASTVKAGRSQARQIEVNLFATSSREKVISVPRTTVLSSAKPPARD